MTLLPISLFNLHHLIKILAKLTLELTFKTVLNIKRTVQVLKMLKRERL